MNISFDQYFLYINTEIPKERYIIENFLNGVKNKKGYRIRKNLNRMREVLRAFPQLQSNQNFLTEGRRLKDEQDTLLHLRKVKIPTHSRLRPYQYEDVQYLKNLDWAGIFNEPRTGKTPTVITLMKELDTKRNLIVAPASLIWNWAKEFETWWPECEVFVLSGSVGKRTAILQDYLSRSKESVLIVSKDTWKTEWEKFSKIAPFDTAIIDEAHFLRNYKTAQSKAVYKIKAKRRYVLSGTPTVKHPSDCWGILHYLCPTQFSSFWQFVDEYFDQFLDFMGHNQIGNPKPHRQQELQELIALNSTQRKRKEVMAWLPDKQRSTFAVRMDGKQQKLYDEMAKFFIASDAGLEVDTSNVIAQLMRLRQLCLDPRLLGFDTEGAKTVALLEYLENHREPIVIMSMFTSYLKMLEPLITNLDRKVGFIHGEMSNQQKQSAAMDFQEGKIDTLLCNCISAGTGFTLDRCETAIFTDKPWNPAELEQAEDRICPTTELKNHKHEIITFVCQNTVDDRINEILEQKKSLTDFVNEGGRDALNKLLKG